MMDLFVQCALPFARRQSVRRCELLQNVRCSQGIPITRYRVSKHKAARSEEGLTLDIMADQLSYYIA